MQEQDEALASSTKAAKNPRLRICLAASGGGHIRQLLDLEACWSKYDFFFVSEDTALSRSLTPQYPVYFVSHFALGQIRHGGLMKAARAGWKNFWQSARIAIKQRPDIVISTGAGSVFFLVLWARLLGAKFFLIESFARFDNPSSFARASARLANHMVVQSQTLSKDFPAAKVFDPLELLDRSRPEKKPLLFATVGVTLPFDRMIEMVAGLKAQGAIPEDIVFQTGIGGLAPPGMTAFETLPFDSLKTYLRDADIVICHGGTGSIITALREGCRTIVVPRDFDKGEHYDDHQQEITKAFAARGLVFAASSPEELASALIAARAAKPVLATTNPTKLIAHLNQVLEQQARR